MSHSIVGGLIRQVVPPINAGFLDKTNIQAHMIGKVKIHDKLVIDKVLYLPDFNVNLISVSRLSKDHNCMIVFEDDSFLIQKRGAIRKIGLTKKLDGLYYLKSSQVKMNASVHVIDTDPSRLWNLRLGHLSHE